MLGKPRIRLNNLKTSVRFPCLGLNPIIDSISPMGENTKYIPRSRSFVFCIAPFIHGNGDALITCNGDSRDSCNSCDIRILVDSPVRRFLATRHMGNGGKDLLAHR